jgi:molybdate transport system substrate-binding protein
MGDPDHVPAGIYGRQALEALGVWRRVEPKIARAGNARAALALVARGEAVAGIVYATDAAISDTVRVVAEFPPDSHAPVSYEAALVAGRGSAGAEGFLAFLASGPARRIFRRHGFSVGE